MCGGEVLGRTPSTSALTAAGLSQLFAIGTGVNHLLWILACQHHRPIGVRLLGFKSTMYLGKVAAALTRSMKEAKVKRR